MKQTCTEFEVDETNRRELHLLEAALYVAGRPLNLEKLSAIIETQTKDVVLKLTRSLVEKYKRYESPLEVLELREQHFIMQLKAKYAHKVKRLSLKPVLTKGPLKTLSYIAYNQPVLQTRVVQVRGNHAYNHIKKLEKLKFITREEEGRTRIIKTTPFFSNYFNLSHNPRTIKKQLKKRI
jgi:segregation and condensation protein B